MTYSATHEEIMAALAPLKGVTVPDANAAQGDTLLTAAQRLVMIYRPLIPALMLLASFGFFPAAIRAGFTLLAQALEILASVTPSTTVASPSSVTASAAADTTTTDPSNDPSFKAGKDL